jgi:hypothetical protein
MPKRKNLKGLPHNFTKSFFGTERYYSRGYMGDWLSNAAMRLNLNTATLDVLSATFTPEELNLHPLTLNAKELKSIIEKELLSNGFANDFISEAKIIFQFSDQILNKRTIFCFPYMIDKEGKRYESDKIIEDVYIIHFDPFDEENIYPQKN